MTLYSDPSELWALIGGSPEGGKLRPPLVARKICGRRNPFSCRKRVSLIFQQQKNQVSRKRPGFLYAWQIHFLPKSQRAQRFFLDLYPRSLRLGGELGCERITLHPPRDFCGTARAGCRRKIRECILVCSRRTPRRDTTLPTPRQDRPVSRTRMRRCR